MTRDQPQPIDPTEILSKRRIAAAFAALTNPDEPHNRHRTARQRGTER
jgi:hypothetical protein